MTYSTQKMIINNGYLSRNYDIFDYFETKIGRNSDYINDSMTRGISFSAELFTERNPCTACGKTIKNFKIMFRNDLLIQVLKSIPYLETIEPFMTSIIEQNMIKCT